MSVIRWPEPFSEQGRLVEGEAARRIGKSALACNPSGCPQTLHVNLFFDGTNNNKDWDTQNKEKPTHSNVARLYNACSDEHSAGEYAFYIPGVGTPFPEIGEYEFSSMGKAMGRGFGMRVVWGYTRVLNALHEAMAGDVLLYDSDSRALCDLIDNEVTTSNETLKEVTREISRGSALVGAVASSPRLYYGYKSKAALERLHGELAALQKKHGSPGGQLNRSIKKVWINVIGFSRGAACARVFVNRLVNTWARGGMIAGAIPYEVNFLGLFDTVASVGIPDTVTALLNLDKLDGHWAWTANGALNVPPSVKKCVHYISIHEQRMSFPLDSIREGDAYTVGAPRRIEVAYPGVHTDVGGGYAIGEEGKSRDGEGSKLSQIPLHNMYIEALKAGVPLLANEEFSRVGNLQRDFMLSSDVARAFNDWLSSVSQKPLDSVETALRIGMGQSLAWRTLRADIGNPQTYITAQEFFKHAKEDPVTPYGLEQRIASKQAFSPYLEKLKQEKTELAARKTGLEMAAVSLFTIPPLAMPMKKMADELGERINRIDTEIRAAAAGKQNRPGEGTTELMTNDKTDLLEAAEEFRLLLAYLRPDQRSRWQAYWARPPADAAKFTSLPYDRGFAMLQNADAYYLTVDRMDLVTHRRQGSKVVWMCNRDLVLQVAGAIAGYQPVLDFVLEPRAEMLSFLLEHTSQEAVTQLPPAAARLFDDYIHDSRAWFRAPYFHEYAPGGYGWARTFFVGNDRRVRHLGLKAGNAGIAAERDKEATQDLGNFIAAHSATLQPPVTIDFDSIPRM